MIRDFLSGASCVFHGITAFYSDRHAWKYTIVPFVSMAVVYGLLICGIHYAVAMATTTLNTWAEQWPSWISWSAAVAGAVIAFFGVVIVILLLAVTVSAFYEIVGGIFFDPLVEYYETKNFGKNPAVLTLLQQGKFLLGTAAFGVFSFFLFIGLLLFSFFVPVIGQVIFVLGSGYIAGVSYMVCSAHNDGIDLSTLLDLAFRHKYAVAGFGVAAYLLLLIPFAALLIIPGVVLGGAELYNTILHPLPEIQHSGKTEI